MQHRSPENGLSPAENTRLLKLSGGIRIDRRKTKTFVAALTVEALPELAAHAPENEVVAVGEE